MTVNRVCIFSKRISALLIIMMIMLSTVNLSVLASEEIKATLKASVSTVHSGAGFQLIVELSSASMNDINAEISDGDKRYPIRIPAGKTEGSVEMTAANSDKAVVKTYTLSSNSVFSSKNNSVTVKILPEPVIVFNAKFIMTNVGRETKVYFRCKNASEMTAPLPISLRSGDGEVLNQYTVDSSNKSFDYTLKIDQNWKFPYSLSVVNELTGSACVSIPVMVIDAKTPGIRRVETSEKKIALGFDCGYNNVYTDYILDTLDEYDAKVTFFVTGFFCGKFPDQLRKIHERGHEIGNHTMNHLRLASLNVEDVYKEIQGVNELVRKETGVSPKIMRPPYGSSGSTVVAVSRMTGCETVLWTMDSYDWDPDKTAQTIIERSTKDMGEGCILLFHNSAPKTKQTLKTILDDYKAKGLKIVPVSELLYDGHYIVDEDGTQKPDPNYVEISGKELMSDRKFSVHVVGEGVDAELNLIPVFSDSPAFRNKNDIEKIKSDPSLMQVSYDFGDTVSPPIKKGDRVGVASFSYNHKVWFTAEMTAADSVAFTVAEKDSTGIVSDSEQSVSFSDNGEEGIRLDVYICLNVLVLAIVILVGGVVLFFRSK